MPPKSKAQARFMRAVASGSIKRKGLSRQTALEYVSHSPTKNLPETVERKKPKKSRSSTAGYRARTLGIAIAAFLLLDANIASAQVRAFGVVDSGNSTNGRIVGRGSEFLASSGGSTGGTGTYLNSRFLGAGFEVKDYSFANISILLSQSSSTNGLEFQWSPLASQQGFVTLESYTLDSYKQYYSFITPHKGRYFRIRYANGLYSLTSFQLTAIHKSFATLPDLLGPNGSALVSLVGVPLVSANTGFGNMVLSSPVDSGGFRPPSLTSMFTKVWGTRLDSMSLIAGTPSMRIAVYKFSGTIESIVSSYGFYSTPSGSTKLFGALPLYSQEFIAGGGIAEPPVCLAVRCVPLFLTSVGDDLTFATTSNGNEGRVRISNLLWSYER